jgi:uncharacterized protein (TIGR03437 family)
MKGVAAHGLAARMMPDSVAGKTSTQLQVIFQGRPSNTLTLPVSPSAPALFSANLSGKGQGAILNQDNSSNPQANPAKKGSVILLFAITEGQTNPPGVDGEIAGAVLPKPVLPVAATIGGMNADAHKRATHPDWWRDSCK